MASFDPSQPAILHERLRDEIVPWTGEHCADWQERAKPHSEGVIGYHDRLFDGWGNPLGG